MFQPSHPNALLLLILRTLNVLRCHRTFDHPENSMVERKNLQTKAVDFPPSFAKNAKKSKALDIPLSSPEASAPLF